MQEKRDDIRLYLARFEKVLGSVETSEGAIEAVFKGYLVVTAAILKENAVSIQEIRRLSAWSDDVPVSGGFLDFAGPRPSEKHPLFDAQAPFVTSLYYPLLGKEEYTKERYDPQYPPLETLVGGIRLDAMEAGPENNFRALLTIDLSGQHQNVLGLVHTLRLRDIPLSFALMQSKPTKRHNSLCECTTPQAGADEQLRLRLRFISMSVDPVYQPPAPANPPPLHPLEDIAKPQIEGACEVWWQRAGIQITPEATIVESVDKKGGSPSVAQQQTLDVSQAGTLSGNAVGVYLVDTLEGNLIDQAGGGGISYKNRTREAWVILEIGKAQNNPYLLAHELGHVLGLEHPGEPLANPYIANGSECSIMVPDSPMSDRNTLVNITNARLPVANGPVEDAGNGTCTLNPCLEQSYYHIVRDFPLDDGEEPSIPHAPIQFWWTHSDVWNSNKLPKTTAVGKYTDGTEMFNLDHSPIHSEPSRLHTNQMYVRLHTGNPLTHDVNVHLFLAVPGVAIEPLTRITPVNAGEVNPLTFDTNSYGPFTDCRPSMGAPRYKNIAWNVPAGYPANCCVFAAAVSANEDDGGLAAIVNDPAGHHFADLFARLGNDNDVAQRNLHIHDILPSPSPLSTTLSWLQFANPFETPGAANLVIDATQAVGLSELRVVQEDGTNLEIEAWEKGPRSLKLANSFKPGRHLDFRLQAVLPPNLLEGSEFPIHLSFQIGSKLVGGFTHLIRVAPLEKVVFQVLDMLYAALADASIASDSPPSRNLATKVRSVASQHASQPEKALTRIGNLAKQMAICAADLDSAPGFLKLNVAYNLQARQIQELLLQLAAILSAGSKMDRPTWLEKVRLLADRLQCIAGRLVRGHQ